MGSTAPLHWSAGGRPVDFFDVKGLVEVLARALDVRLRFGPAEEPFLVPGQTGAILCAGGPRDAAVLGFAGQVAPSVADARGLSPKERVYVAELNLDLLDQARAASSDAIRSLPRHPFVIRDLSIVVADTLPAEIIRGTIQAAGRDAPAPLTAIAFFDRYHGKGVPANAVSISVRLTFQADRTLTDAEVQQSVDNILTALAHEHGAVQR
jgi:phenylalanyl-tRNA synthetase beta chain